MKIIMRKLMLLASLRTPTKGSKAKEIHWVLKRIKRNSRSLRKKVALSVENLAITLGITSLKKPKNQRLIPWRKMMILSLL